jgi:hypothetical protein
MKILQQLPAGCSCAICLAGCQCGDCRACSNPKLDRSIVKNAKRLTALACIVLFMGGFVSFVPIVALGANPTVTETFSLKLPPSDNSTVPLGSLAFCYFGQGAVIVHGVYYPSVNASRTASRICGHA